MVAALTSDGAIEAEAPKEVALDIVSVINQYVKDEQEVSDKARDMLAARGLPPNELGKIKKLLADQKKIKLGDDAIDYLLDQLVEMLMHSNNVDEIFVEDYELRRRMRDPLRKQLSEEDELQKEVRARLRHVEEGSALWEVEYKRMMDDIKRRKGI